MGTERYWRMVYTVTTRSNSPILWLFEGCEQHCREYIESSREVGDAGTYHVFDSPNQDCVTCEAGQLLENQTAVETL